MKQISIPALLANLPTAKSYQQKRPHSQSGINRSDANSVYSQSKRSASSMSVAEPVQNAAEIPSALGNLSKTALEVGLAMKYIPVQFSGDQKIFQAADEVDRVVDAITDHRTDVVDGTGITQFWSDVRANNLVWVSCDILKKLDANKFLIFINENASQKVVSTENLIFQNVILLTQTDNRDQDGNYEVRRDIVEVKSILQPFFDKNIEIADYINIFQQQKSNFQMRQRFEEAIRRFGELSISITKEQFEQYDDYTEFAVVNMQNTRLHDLTIPDDAPGAQRVLLLRKQVQDRVNQSYRVPLNKQQIILDKIISQSVSLCTEAINSIDFAQIQHIGGIFDFEQVQNAICQEFVQEAQLVDSQLLILRQAKHDAEHELHWCAPFLSVFLWSRFKIFQMRNLFQYCFGVEAPDESNYEVFDAHKHQFHSAQITVSRHLQNIYSKTFMALRRYIQLTFEQHSEYIMASATKLISMIWTNELPLISNKVSESFIQHFSHKGINQFFLQVKTKGNLKNLSFKQSFSEKLINTHKVVYQILTPHLIDQIMSDFAYEVLQRLNDKLHKYQASHGKTPSLKMRDQFAESSYRTTHDKYVQIFKIMQITFLKIFIDELYETALPQWFYFLLALVHGGKKRQVAALDQRTDITRFLHTTPNDQGFYSALQKDVDSLNKFTDFKIPYDKAIGQRVLQSLAGLEFALVPVFHDNFVSGVQFTPDPLQMALKLEECIQELHVYYSSSPKFSDILIFDVTTTQVKNKLTLQERELLLDKSNLSYQQYLNIAYNGAALAGGSEGNPFNLTFLQADGQPKASKTAGKFITLTNAGFKLREAAEEEFEFDIKVETRLAEAVYYEPSILLQKLVRLSKMAGEKLYRYFDQLKKYFSNHIQNLLTQIARIFDVDNLLPSELVDADAYTDILKSVQQNTKMLKIQGTNEEQIRLRMKPISDFLHAEQLITLVSDQFKCGNAPPPFIQRLIDGQLRDTVDVIRVIYNNMYSILGLPGVCYYATFRINLSSLLSALQVQDKLLFDSYSQRLSDYFCIAMNIMNACLLKIKEKLGQTTFSSTAEIGEIYEVCKLFGCNRDAWLACYGQLESIVVQYEELSLGTLSVPHYNAMSSALYKSRALFKRVFQGQAQVVTRVGEAYQQAFSFIQNIQYGFDSLIGEIFQRVQEYFSISYDDWMSCTENQSAFKQKYPLLTSSIRFPKAIRLDDYALIDIKRLVREVETTSQMPIFKSTHVKLHVFERFQQFKPDNLNDAFQELDDVIGHSIDTLKLLQQLKVQLLGNTEIEYFDALDKLLFGTAAKKAYYVQQLRSHGERVDFNRETMRGIVASGYSSGGNALARLLNLQPVFQTAYRLVGICGALPTSYMQYMEQPLVLINTEQLRKQLVEALRISAVVLHRFDPAFQIVSLARNLNAFIQQRNAQFRLLFLAKIAVYENSFQVIERERAERVRRPDIDIFAKIDACDSAASAGLINAVVQSVNFKISDDVRAGEITNVLYQYIQFIFKFSGAGIKKARIEKLLQIQQQDINKMFLADTATSFAMQPTFELFTMQKREKPHIQLEFDQYGSVGVDAEKIKANCKCFYCRNPANEPIFTQNAVQGQKSGFFEQTRPNQLTEYLTQQKHIILQARFLDSVSALQAQTLLNQTDSLLQMVQLHWHVFVYCQRVAMLAELAPETQNANFAVSGLDADQTDRFQQIVKQFRSLLTGCYTTASNAYQLAQRKFVKDKLWEYAHELYVTHMAMTRITLPYFLYRQPHSHEFLMSVLLDLYWCDAYYTPIMENVGPHYNGALIYLLPDEINNSLMSILAGLGIQCAGLNILYFMFRTPDGRSYGYFYVDGFTFIQNIYFKFVYPLIFQTLRDIYLHLTAERLKTVILATLEFHMLYWQQRFNKEQQLPVRQVLQAYPPAISFAIISQLVMDQVQQIFSLSGSHDAATQQLSGWLKRLKDLLEQCDIYAAGSDSDLAQMQQSSAQSMFISLENQFFYTQRSQFQTYVPARQFRGAQGVYNGSDVVSRLNATAQSDDSQSVMAINFQNLDVLDAIAAAGPGSDSESSMGPIEGENTQICDGWSAESFALLSLQQAGSEFSQEQMVMMHYFIGVLQQLLTNSKSNSYYADFCLQYCDGNYEIHIHALKKHVADLKRDIFDGKRHIKDFAFKPHLQVFNGGSFGPSLQGNLKTYCNYSSQLNIVSQLQLGHYVPRFVRAVEMHECLFCATPNIDKYYYPQLYCIFYDTMQLLLQQKVTQFHLTSKFDFSNLKHSIMNGDIVLVSGADTCDEQNFNTFVQLVRAAPRSSACIIVVVPCLFINEIGQTSIQESGLAIIRSLGLCNEQIIRIDELFANSMQSEYEQMIVSLSQAPIEMHLPQNIVSLIIKAPQAGMQEKIIKLCFLIAQQSKFNQEITFSIASLASQCFPGQLAPTLAYEQLAKQIMSADPFLYKLFEVCDSYKYGVDDQEAPKKQTTSFIPIQLSSFVFMPKKFVDQCQLNTQGWKYVADIILLLFSANVQQLGVLVSNQQKFATTYLAQVISGITLDCIEFSTKIITSSDDFGFEYDNQISVLQHMLYIVLYFKNDYSDGLGYQQIVEEFLARQKPLSTFVLLISNDSSLVLKYSHARVNISENIISNRALLKEVSTQFKFKDILLSDIDILSQQTLTPTEFTYVFSKFSVTWEQRETQCQLRDVFSAMSLDLLDLFCQAFQLNDVFAVRSFLSTYFSLLELYGVIQTLQNLQDATALLDSYQFHVSDAFLTQLAFSSRGTSDALGKMIGILFLLAFAAGQVFCVVCRQSCAQDQKLMEQYYQICYSNIILNKSSQQQYTQLTTEILQKLAHFSASEYVDTMQRLLPLPFSQQAAKGADFSNRYTVYLPQFSSMTGVAFTDLKDFQDQLILFENGYHTNKLIVDVQAVKVSLPYRFSVHRNFQIKSELFLTDSSTKESRIKQFFKQFGSLLEFGDDYETMIVFLLFCNIKYQVPTLLYSAQAMQFIDTVFGKSVLFLHEFLRSFQSIQMLFQNREYSELKLLQYNVDSQEDVTQVIVNMRELMTLKDQQAIFNIFTIVKLLVAPIMLADEMLSDFLRRNVQIPNIVGQIGHYTLHNCAFVVIPKEGMSVQQVKSDKMQVIGCDWQQTACQKFNQCVLNDICANAILAQNEERDQAIKAIQTIKYSETRFINEEIVQKYYNLHFAAVAQLNLPFFASLINCNFVNCRGQPALFNYIGEAFNIGLYRLYYNRLLFGCIQDASRAEYKESFQEMYDKRKNEQTSLYDFNDEIIDEAGHFKYFIEAAGLPIFQQTIPLHVIRLQSLYSYIHILQAISIVTDAIPDIPIDQMKIRSRNLLLDLGNACSVDKFLNLFYTQGFSALSARDKIYSCVRVAISIILGLQKGQPYPQWARQQQEQGAMPGAKTCSAGATQLHGYTTTPQCQNIVPQYLAVQVPFVPTINNQTYHVAQPLQMQNYDTFTYLTRKQTYDQVIVVVPLSLLIKHKLLSIFIDLFIPGNQANLLYTQQELVDICQEASIFSKLENVSPAVLQLAMSLKMQVFIVQDVPFDVSLLPNFVNYINLMGFDTILKIDSFYSFRYIDCVRFNNNCSERFTEQFQKRFCIKNLESLIVESDRKICVLVNYGYSQIVKDTDMLPIQLLTTVALYAHALICRKQSERKTMFKELQAKIGPVLSVCARQTVELEHFQQQLRNEQLILQSLQDTQASLVKINNDLQSELNQIIKQLTLGTTKAQHMQQKIDALRKNQQSLIVQNNFELEQITKTEILDLYNSNITNPAMLFALQAIWYIISDRAHPNVYTVTYPDEQHAKQLWREIQNEMFAQIAIPQQLQSFAYQHLSPDKVQFIKRVCALPDFQNQLLPFTETRLQRKLVNYILALNNYFNNLIDEAEELELRQLKQSNEQLEKKRQYLKDEQQGTKIKMGNNQKTIDQSNVRVDQTKDQVNQQANVVKTAEIIQEYFIQQQNDIVFDIGQCDSQINISPYSAVIIAFAVFYGFDIIQKLIQLLTPPKGAVCLYCQGYCQEACEHCQQCRCLCTCLYDVDDSGNTIRSAKKAPIYQIAYPVNSKDNIIAYLNGVNANFLGKRSAHDVLLGLGLDALLELHSLIFFMQCFQNKCIAVSARYFERFLCIAEQVTSVSPQQTFVLGVDNMAIRQQIAEYALKDTILYVVLYITETSQDVEQMLQEISSYNTAVLQGEERVVTIGRQKIRITPQLKCLRVYVLFQSQVHQKYQRDHTYKNLILMSSGYLRNQGQMLLHQALILQDEKQQTKFFQTNKEQSDMIVQRYLRPLEMNEYAQAVFDVKQMELQQVAHINAITQQCKALKQETISQQLTLLQQSISNLNNQQLLIKKQKQFYQEQQTKLVEIYRDKTSQHNQYQHGVLMLMRLYTKLAKYYPPIVRAVTDQVFQRGGQSEVVQNAAPYTQILKNIVNILNGSVSNNQLEMIIFVSIIYLEFRMQQISSTVLQILFIVINCKLTAQRKSFQEATQFYEPISEQLQQINSWCQKYPEDYNMMLEQDDAFAYVQMQATKPTIPQFFKNKAPDPQLYLFAIIIFNQKQYNLAKVISQFLRVTTNYSYIFENIRKLDNKQFFGHITSLAKQGAVILLTENVNRTIEDVVFLSKLTNTPMILQQPTQAPERTADSLQVAPISYEMWEENDLLQPGDKNMLFIVEKCANRTALLHDSKIAIIDFDSCILRNELESLKTQAVFAEVSTNPFSNDSIQRATIVQNQSPFSEHYLLLYLAAEQLLLYSQQNENIMCNKCALVSQLYSRFAFFSQAARADQECVNENLTSVCQFIECFAKDAQRQLSQVLKHHDQIQYIQQYNGLPQQLQQLLHLDFFKNLPSGIIVKTASLIKQLERYTPGALVQSLQQLEKQPVYVRHESQMLQSLILLRFLSYINDSHADADKPTKTEFNAETLHRSELATYLHEIVDAAQQVTLAVQKSASATPSLSRNVSNSSVISDNHEETNLKQVNFSEAFSARQNASFQMDNTRDESSLALLVSQQISSDQAQACWGDKLVGIEISFQYATTKYKFPCLVEVCGLLYAARSDFEPYGIVIKCIQ